LGRRPSYQPTSEPFLLNRERMGSVLRTALPRMETAAQRRANPQDDATVLPTSASSLSFQFSKDMVRTFIWERKESNFSYKSSGV